MPITGTAEDREQIRELYARYAFTIDHGPFDEWVRCFTADGVFESPRLGRHAGHEALAKFTQMYKNSAGDAQVRHMMSNVTFRVEGDTGMGGCYLAYYHCKGGKATLEAIGRYQDELRKVNGEWLFQYRQVYIDGHG